MMIIHDQYDIYDVWQLLTKNNDTRDFLLTLNSTTEYVFVENQAAYKRNYMAHMVPDPGPKYPGPGQKYPGIKNFRYSLSCLTHMTSLRTFFYEGKDDKYLYSANDMLTMFLS